MQQKAPQPGRETPIDVVVQSCLCLVFINIAADEKYLLCGVV